MGVSYTLTPLDESTGSQMDIMTQTLRYHLMADLLCSFG